MKKILTVLSLTTLLTQAQAQYKKASFFARSGRFYEIGSTFRFLSGGRSGGTGIFISVGNATPGKHLHHTFDFEYVTSVKFHYSSTGTKYNSGGQSVTVPTTVTGSMAGSWVLPRYSLGYFFGDSGNDDVKLLPFINAHIGVMFGGTVMSQQNPAFAEKQPSTDNTAFLYGFGGGALYKLNNTFGLRASVQYNGVANTTSESATNYVPLPSHVSASVAIRFMLHGDK